MALKIPRGPGLRKRVKQRCWKICQDLRDVTGARATAVLLSGIPNEPDSFAIAVASDVEDHAEQLEKMEDIFRQAISQIRVHIERLRQEKGDKIIGDVLGGRVIH